jgi:hypothetical protein
MRLGGTQNRSGNYGEEKILASARNRTPVIQTELSRLFFVYTVHDQNHLRVPVGNKTSENYVFSL